MKKAILFLLLLFALPAGAKDVIYKTTDGTVMKCTYKMLEGNIQEYNKNKPFFYTFKDKKIYSRNFFELFVSSWRKNYKKDIPHVMFLRLKKDKIRFYEFASTDTGGVSHKVIIDRKTGKCTFKASRTYHWSGRTMYQKKAKGVGQCTIVK